jgi:APA family basic amino acid/polyamine antiporter
MTSGQLKRQVGLGGAILLGLGSIVGTGVFVSLGLAVGVAGNWAVCALAIATVLATMNALSSAQLAANHPVSGGTYAYGYRYLGPQLGFVAGLSFLLAKSASAAAAAIGLVSYVSALAGWGNLPVNLLAAGVVMLMTGLVATGLRRANLVNALLVGATLLALFSLIGVAANDGYLLSGQYISQWPSVSAPNLFEAAALLFVAFTGYGRIATLGEEVIAPRRTIPRAIIVTLWVTGILYLGVLLSGLAVLGESGFVREMQLSAAPLQAVAAALDRPGLRLFLSLAAITAMAGVLLNLLLGLSRVAFAMGREGDAPAALANLDGRREPRIATLCVGGVIVLITLFGGLANIWSFSAFAVLVYYAITNLAALQLRDEDRLYPRIISIFGLVGCLGLSVWVTPRAIVVGVAILLIGIGLRATFRR